MQIPHSANAVQQDVPDHCTSLCLIPKTWNRIQGNPKGVLHLQAPLLSTQPTSSKHHEHEQIEAMSGLATSMSIPTPSKVTGGCLCGGVRYQIDFSSDHDWKRGSSTCQCTQCRKNCGSLVYNFHTVTASEITWTSQSTYAEYTSSPGCYRSFCNKCGSPIAWTDRSVNTDVGLAVGTIDEEFLVGERDSEDKPKGGFGLALANPEARHYYIRNEIPGVTDGIAATGTKFWEGSKEGAMRRDSKA